MIKIEKYTGQKDYMYPNGEMATASRVAADFPAVTHFVHIVETDANGEVMFALQNLSAVRSQMGIDSTLSEADAIAEIERLRNATTSNS